MEIYSPGKQCLFEKSKKWQMLLVTLTHISDKVDITLLFTAKVGKNGKYPK
jgi:hypothetical protein